MVIFIPMGVGRFLQNYGKTALRSLCVRKAVFHETTGLNKCSVHAVAGTHKPPSGRKTSYGKALGSIGSTRVRGVAVQPWLMFPPQCCYEDSKKYGKWQMASPEALTVVQSPG